VNGETGKLTYLASTPTETQPRGFAIARRPLPHRLRGKSETISVYAIDQASGALTLLRQYPGGKGANWSRSSASNRIAGQKSNSRGESCAVRRSFNADAEPAGAR